eukprot:25229-Rhodomonas_salina.1
MISGVRSRTLVGESPDLTLMSVVIIKDSDALSENAHWTPYGVLEYPGYNTGYADPVRTGQCCTVTR